MCIVFISRDRTQKSKPVQLRGGRVYFVEVVMKEGGGGDHVSVGVTLPRTRGIRPISKKDLYRRRPGMRVFLFFPLIMSFLHFRERPLKQHDEYLGFKLSYLFSRTR